MSDSGQSNARDFLLDSAPENPSILALRLYADSATGQLKCIDSTGASAYPAVSNPTPAWLNVKNFEAKGDARAVKDASVTNNSKIVHSVTANFAAADVGKQLTAVYTPTGGVIAFGNIVSVQSASQCTLDQNAISTQSSSVFVVFGSDDTLAIQAAWAACIAQIPLGSATLYFPAGGYIANASLVTFVGSGSTYAPNIRGDGGADGINVQDNSPSGAVSVIYYGGNYPTSGSGPLFSFVTAYATISDLSIHGGYMSLTSPGACIEMAGGGFGRLQNVAIAMWGGLGTTGPAYAIYTTSYHLDLYNCTVQQSFIGIVASGAAISLFNVGVNNCVQQNYMFSAATIRWFGGIDDESGSAESCVIDNSDASIFGVDFYAKTNGTAVRLKTGGTSRFFGCSMGPFNVNNNSNGLQVDAGATASSSNSRFYKSGSGAALINEGLFIDAGGNKITNLSGGGTWLSMTTNTNPPATS